jgi:hypothetical protein
MPGDKDVLIKHRIREFPDGSVSHVFTMVTFRHIRLVELHQNYHVGHDGRRILKKRQACLLHLVNIPFTVY